MEGQLGKLRQRGIHQQPHRSRRIEDQAEGADGAGALAEHGKKLLLAGEGQPRRIHLLGNIRRAQPRLGPDDAQAVVLFALGGQKIVLADHRAQRPAHGRAFVQAGRRGVADAATGNAQRVQTGVHRRAEGGIFIERGRLRVERRGKLASRGSGAFRRGDGRFVRAACVRGGGRFVRAACVRKYLSLQFFPRVHSVLRSFPLSCTTPQTLLSSRREDTRSP